MRILQKASGVLKDQNSILQAKLSRSTALRNPDIEKAVIRATSHYDLRFDRLNIERVCEWIRLSPLNLKPVLFSVATRLQKTRNWIVALKGLYLMHVVINSKIPCARRIGRLPFDLSDFKGGAGGGRHCRQAKIWPYCAFIRTYYAFLDSKSTVVFQHMVEDRTGSEVGGFMIMHELIMLQRMQGLIDRLMQIRPQSTAAFVPLILDIMNGVIIEIYDLYSKICRGIATVLINIYAAEKAEADLALKVVRKATQQGDDLSYYFEFCQEIGVPYASQFPVIDRIPDEGIHELEQIVKAFSDDTVEAKSDIDEQKKLDDIDGPYYMYRDGLMTTIITDEWEKFEEDNYYNYYGPRNPFVSPLRITHAQDKITQYQELPDLIIL